MKLIHIVFATASLLIISGCQSTQQNLPDGFTACPEVRPEICTMQYEPTDGLLTSGEIKSFGNACSACGDPDVIATKPADNKQ